MPREPTHVQHSGNFFNGLHASRLWQSYSLDGSSKETESLLSKLAAEWSKRRMEEER